MASKKENNYFNYSEKTGGLSVVKNDDLICKDCRFKIDGHTDVCLYYPELKPGSVFYKNQCDYHKEKK